MPLDNNLLLKSKHPVDRILKYLQQPSKDELPEYNHEETAEKPKQIEGHSIKHLAYILQKCQCQRLENIPD